METAAEIRRIAEEKLTDPSHFLVEVILSSRNRPQKVTVIIDGDAGISIDNCAILSREISKVLDDSFLLADSYTLEVTTPGLDQPLKLHRQYRKNVGRRLRVRLAETTVEGKLVDVSEAKITIEHEKKEGKKKIEITPLEIQFSDIDKSFVLVSFK